LLLKKQKEGEKYAAHAVSRQVIEEKRNKKEKREKKLGDGCRDFLEFSRKNTAERERQTPFSVTAAEGQKIPDAEDEMHRGKQKEEWAASQADGGEGKKNIA
jgi:hypothetical protein